jgi:multidrug efflux pump subunit AcrA (membrane-fusion protein)
LVSAASVLEMDFMSRSTRRGRSATAELASLFYLFVVTAPALVLLAPVFTATGCGGAQAPSDGPPQAPAPVVVSPVRERTVTVEQAFVGTVVPIRMSTVSSPVEGRVVAFLVNEGDYVEAPNEDRAGVQNGDDLVAENNGQVAVENESHVAVENESQVAVENESHVNAEKGGQVNAEDVEPVNAEDADESASPTRPLARLRTQTLEIQLAAAKAELKVREAELEELRLSAPKEIEQAQARKQAAEALMDFTRSRVERSEEIRQRSSVQGAISDDELEEQRSAAEAARETYLERKAALELAESGMWDEKIRQAAARVEAQREAIRKLEDDLSLHEIYAPFNGYVVEEHTEVGQWLSKGDPVAKIVDVSEVEIEVPVLERHVPFLRRLPAETMVPVEITSLPGMEFIGRIVSIVPQADPLSRNFPVKVRVANRRMPEPSGGNPDAPAKGRPAAETADPRALAIQPGMFARVHLPVDNVDRPLVHKDALVLSEDATTVCAVQPEEAGATTGRARVEQIPVELGEAKEDWIEIRGPVGEDGSLPLKPGQLVILMGNERVNPGQEVTIVDSTSPEGDTQKKQEASRASSRDAPAGH